MKRRCTGIVLSVCLILVFAASSVAFGQDSWNQNGEITPMYTIITSISADLEIKNNTANCSGTVHTGTPCDIKITVQLQQLILGKWQTIESWSNSRDSVRTLSQSGSRSVGSGTFRSITTATVTNAAGSSETASVNSLTKSN